MHTQIIISAANVEKLKQKARNLKRDNGISHHEALDQVAKAAGFNHWHHVSESASAFKPTEQAYYFGVIIAMDIKDAMDFRDPSGGFVEDPFAFVLCADDIYAYSRATYEDGESTGDDPNYKHDKEEWMQDRFMDYVFFRYTGSDIPANAKAVVAKVHECESSFWLPEFIWHKGVFQERPSDHSLDEDDEIVGIQF
jgi:hypothetical protein